MTPPMAKTRGAGQRQEDGKGLGDYQMSERGRGWAVIGGGLLGLTMAHRLTQAGERVTIFEAAPELGGLASAWRLGDVVWDRHYHVIMLSDMSLRALLDELGLADELRFDETKTGFFTGEGFYRMATAIDYLKFPALSLIDKVRLAATLFYISRIKDGRALEKVPLAAWLTRISGRRVFEQMWRPLLAAKMGDNYKIASASFIWSYVARIYAARKGGMKREMFGYVPGGYARILGRFGERLAEAGVGIELSAPVEAIERRADGLAVTTPKGTHTFDRVVVTAAGPHAARMAKGLSADEKERLERHRLPGDHLRLGADRPAACRLLPHLHHRRLDSVHRDHRDVGPGRCATRISAAPRSSICRGTSPPTILTGSSTTPRSRSASSPALPGSIRTSGRRTSAPFRVSRVRQVYAIATLNYSDRLPPMVTSVPGLYIVNSAHIVNGTLAVNETVALADRAAPEVLAAAASLPTATVPAKEHAA